MKTQSIRFVFLFSIFLLSQAVKAGDDLLLYPVEKTAVKSEMFRAAVNGKDAFTQSFKDIHYLRFAQKGKISVEITCLQKVEGLEVSPKADITNLKIENDRISFRLTKAGYHVVTLNGKERLFILTDDLQEVQRDGLKKNWVSVLKYGADNTGSILSTSFIQKALDATAAKKQTLYFPAGIYKTGTLKIPSCSRVYLEAGALIKGSENKADYPVDEGRKESDEVADKAHYTDNGEWMTFSRLLLIENADDVKLWGAGIIDGSGSVLRPQGKPANLIRIRKSRNVLIEGLLLRDPACWNTHILYSDGVVIRNIKMINDRSVANTDGFDPDASKNVLIDHCFAYCSDDNVAIKTTNNGGLLQACEDITVKDCVFLTKKSSLKLGTETKGPVMQHILFQNNYVMEADRGIVLYCYDGATFQDIQFVGNYFEKGYPDNQKKAIHFQIKKRSGEGEIKNILVKDCVFSDAFHSASEIVGLDEKHTINGIQFKNVRVGNKLCLNADDLHLKTNAYVQNVVFEK